MLEVLCWQRTEQRRNSSVIHLILVVGRGKHCVVERWEAGEEEEANGVWPWWCAWHWQITEMSPSVFGVSGCVDVQVFRCPGV